MTRITFLVFLICAAALPSCAGMMFTLGDYTIYDCGQLGTSAYQACQDSMAMGELQFLAGYTPQGLQWSNDYLSALPPLSGIWHYGIRSGGLSSDSRWAIISAIEGLGEDIIPEYVWHDGVFTTSAAAGIPVLDLVPAGTGVISINDQGMVAGINGTWCVLVGPLGCTYGSLFGDPGWYPALSIWGPVLNDNNQVLVEGFNGNYDYLLFNPPGAPVPGVPEPASLVLLSSAILAAILIRKIHFTGLE